MEYQIKKWDNERKILTLENKVRCYDLWLRDGKADPKDWGEVEASKHFGDHEYDSGTTLSPYQYGAEPGNSDTELLFKAALYFIHQSR